ncbi:DUF2057 family protein [Shewanella sp.]|uniref:DUF2057 family protein n=1 Tax=Shewanella sp. TaxID=50422 RepID=UPI002587F906|nr:DUF2057 family protein [Shewanella sp.]MCJ8303241.1 DUF2057 family protein [Shewanella sp.]
MKKLILASLLTVISSASLAATISFPDYIAVQAVDGKAIANSHQVTVQPGQHLIELKLIEDFSAGADDTNFIKSKPLYWSVNIKKDEDIRISTGEILSITEAEEFISSPVITLNSVSIKNESVSLVNHEQLMAIIMKQHSEMMINQ